MSTLGIRCFPRKSAYFNALCYSQPCNKLHQNAVKMPRSATELPRESGNDGFGQAKINWRAEELSLILLIPQVFSGLLPP